MATYKPKRKLQDGQLEEIKIPSSSVEGLNPFFYKAKIKSFLYTMVYDTLDYDFAKQYIDEKYDHYNAGCSTISKGNFVGRNFDWYYDNEASFVVRTSRSQGRYASVGVASGIKELTEEFANSNAGSSLYKVLPFLMEDGINEYSVYCNINVVPAGDKGLTSGTTPQIEQLDKISGVMLVRYILDKFSSAKSAVEYIRDYVSVYGLKPENGEAQEFHFLVRDLTNTYILEFVNNALVILSSTDSRFTAIPNNKDIMMNFYLSGWNGQVKSVVMGNSVAEVQATGLTDHAMGLERYNIASAKYNNLTSKEAFVDLMTNDLKYTKTYQTATSPFWHSEYNAQYQTFGNVTIYSASSAYTGVEAYSKNKFEHRSRSESSENYGSWQTAHSSIYDVANKCLYLYVQEENDETIHKLVISYADLKTSEIINDSGFITIEDVPEIDETNLVHKTGDETINGNKTFNGTLYAKQVGSNPRNEYGSEFYFYNCNAEATSPYNFGIYQWNDVFQFTTRTSSNNVYKSTAFEIYGSTGATDYKVRPTLNGSGMALQSEVNAKQDAITTDNKLSYQLLKDTPTIPTNTNQLTNGAGFITSASLTDYMYKISGTPTAGNIVTITDARHLADSGESLQSIKDIAEGKTTTYVIDAKTNITGTESSTGAFTNVTAITGVTIANLKLGDNIFVKKVDDPDYWVSAVNKTADVVTSVSLNKLETQKTDLTPYDQHIANTSNPHSVTKSQVGLGNVDNTSDLNKPISNAVQNALNGKISEGANISLLNNNLHFVTASDLPESTSELTNNGDGSSPFATQAYVSAYHDSTKANDNAVVHNTGSEVVDGTKTFQAVSFDTLKVKRNSNSATATIQFSNANKTLGNIGVDYNGKPYFNDAVNNVAHTLATLDDIVKSELDETCIPVYNETSKSLQNSAITISGTSFLSFANGTSSQAFLPASSGTLAITSQIPDVSYNSGTGVLSKTVNGTASVISKSIPEFKSEDMSETHNYKYNIDVFNVDPKMSGNYVFISTINGVGGTTTDVYTQYMTDSREIGLSKFWNDAGFITSASLPTNYVTTDTQQNNIYGSKTFTSESKFTNSTYCPTWIDIAGGIGKSSCFTRGAFMQAITGQLIMPNTNVSDSAKGYNTEANKLKIQAITGTSSGQPILADVVKIDSSGNVQASAYYVGASGNAHIQYNSSNKSIEFVF